MKKNVLWITETAAMLALLIALQWLGSQIPEPTVKQLITGSLVNCVLVVTTLVAGRSSGLTVALISPILACMFKIAPVLIAAPVIMVGNVCYVLLLSLLLKKSLKLAPVALAAASVLKFGVLYLLGVVLAGGLLFDALNGQTLAGMPVMSQVVLKQVTNMFSWFQLATALIGGTLALVIVPTLRKALHK